MKKLILATALVFAIGSFNSCSSRDDDPATPTEKQDFTSATYIKTVLQGEWKGISTSNDGKAWTDLGGQYNVGYKTTYKFSGDNFTYRPFLKDEFATEYSGTYRILPVTGDNNAVLLLDFNAGSYYSDKPLTLLSYENNTVTFVQPENTAPNGVQYYKFQKQ